jgi:hypothetical protein
MKILAKFSGWVKKFNPPPQVSYVVLKNLDTGEVAEATAVSSKLLEQCIDKDGCEFEIVIQESVDGKQQGFVKKISPLSSEPHKEVDSEGMFDI